MSTDPCPFNDPNKKFSDMSKIPPGRSADETRLEQQFFRYELQKFKDQVAPNTDYQILYEKAMFFDTLVALAQGEIQSRAAGITYRGQLDLAIDGLKAGTLESFFSRSGANYTPDDFRQHIKGEPFK